MRQKRLAKDIERVFQQTPTNEMEKEIIELLLYHLKLEQRARKSPPIKGRRIVSIVGA